MTKKMTARRKKAIKTLSVGGGIFILGLIVIFIGMKAAGGGLGRFIKVADYKKAVYSSSMSPDECSKIIIDATGSSISVEPSEDDGIHIAYQYSDDENYEITEKNGVLRARAYAVTYEFFDLNLSFSKPRTEVVLKIPQNYEGELSLESDTGKVTLEGFTFLKKVTLHSLEGQVEAKNCIVSDSFVLSAGGKITASDLRADTFSVTCSGLASLSSLSAKSVAVGCTGEGSADISGVSTKTLRCDTEKGSITVSVPNASAWTVKGTTSGNLNIPATVGGNSMILFSDSGDITVKEAKE